MRYGVAYMKQTEAAYAQQVKHCLEKQLHRRARQQGYELKKIEPSPSEAETAREEPARLS